LITKALPRLTSAIAGLLLLLQPSLAFLWDVVFFNRETSPMAWSGVALAIVSIYLGITSKPGSSSSGD
jgi:drug/metabolite transporter (DMT)-like permease